MPTSSAGKRQSRSSGGSRANAQREEQQIQREYGYAVSNVSRRSLPFQGLTDEQKADFLAYQRRNAMNSLDYLLRQLSGEIEISTESEHGMNMRYTARLNLDERFLPEWAVKEKRRIERAINGAQARIAGDVISRLDMGYWAATTVNGREAFGNVRANDPRFYR